MDKFDRKMENYSKKTDEKMDALLQIIKDTVGTQLHGMNSTIAKMKEDDRYKHFNERITNVEKKILDVDEQCKNRSDETRGSTWRQNQGKAVITGFHSGTPESEVVHLLKETITEVGMSFGNARIERFAKSITHAFIYFKSDDE